MDGRADDVRLRRETVIQDGGKNAGIRVKPQNEEGPPTHGPREVHALGQGHFREPPEQIPVGRPADLRVDERVGRELGKASPEECRNQREGLPPGGVRVAREEDPDGVIPARVGVSDDFLNLRGRNPPVAQAL